MRRPGAPVRIARTSLVLTLLLVVLCLNATNLIDAYGSGSPYYGRTTNMDKWNDPLPWLLPLDVIVIVAVLALIFRNRHKPG